MCRIQWMRCSLAVEGRFRHCFWKMGRVMKLRKWVGSTHYTTTHEKRLDYKWVPRKEKQVPMRFYILILSLWLFFGIKKSNWTKQFTTPTWIRLLNPCVSNCHSFSCHSLSSEYRSDVNILPQSPAVEIGKNFTATCILANTSKATADDIIWYSSKIIPREQYTKINTSAVNVTITITSETQSWLFCKVNKSKDTKDTYGIELHKGCKFLCVCVCVCVCTNIYFTGFICYLFNPGSVNIVVFFAFLDPPEKPENLSCVALQVDQKISFNITCSWDVRKRGTLIQTTTTLFYSSL